MPEPDPWSNYRCRRRVFVFLLLALLPTLILLTGPVERLFGSETPLLIVAYVWLVAIFAAFYWMNAFPCPRCKRAFCRTRWRDVVLPPMCMNCGLPKWAPLESVAEEPSSTEPSSGAAKSALPRWGLALSLIALAAGLLLHILSFFPTVHVSIVFAYPLHVGSIIAGCIVGWIARVPPKAAGLINNRVEHRFFVLLFQHIPLPIYVLLGVIAMYSAAVWNHAMREGLDRGDPEVRNGKFVLVNGDHVVGDLDSAKYYHLLALKVRSHSAITIVIDLASAVTILSYMRLERKDKASGMNAINLSLIFLIVQGLP
jgi:hypothetical protein